jgi:hypothetical protein
MPYTEIIERNDNSYDSNIWIKIGNCLICFVYLQHANSTFINLLPLDPAQALEGDIDKYSLLYPDCHMAVVGDINAHCMAILDNSSPDARVDSRGCMLIELCAAKNLKILNGSPPGCTGPTLLRTDVFSVIDYAIVSNSLCSTMKIHDFNVLSEHAAIEVTLTLDWTPSSPANTKKIRQLPYKCPPAALTSTPLTTTLSMVPDIRTPCTAIRTQQEPPNTPTNKDTRTKSVHTKTIHELIHLHCIELGSEKRWMDGRTEGAILQKQRTDKYHEKEEENYS